MRQSLDIGEFALHYNVIGGVASLVIWYVDLDLTTNPTSEQLASQLPEARASAIEVSMQVRDAIPCSPSLLHVINAVIVDASYQGWFSGAIAPRDLPPGPQPSEDEIAAATQLFTVGYERTALRHEYFPGACGWPEARDRLQSHFSSDRQNVAFYFVIDNNGANVWVQWDGPSDPIATTPSLGNVLLALDCFSPRANIIYIVVDQYGVAHLIGYIPEGDTSRASILYEQ